MLEGIPKREYPKLFYRYAKEFFEVLAGKTSLKLYLAHNFPSFYKAKFREGEVLKWKGSKFELPKSHYDYNLERILILGGMYSIPECHVKPNDVVFDVGAHFGFFSYYAIKSGAKEVYAFEPNPYVFEKLLENVRLWSDKIKPINKALWSDEAELTLFIPADYKLHGWASAQERIKAEKVKVKTTTIDEFVEKNKVERLDFIKIDAEGAEREIIKGAKETIKRFKPRMAISAYHLPDDREKIPELVLSIREDYRFKLVNKGEEDLFFF